MKKNQDICFSILSLVFSVVALLIVFATAGGNFYGLEIDSASLLVGVLATLVTALVGFQIVNLVSVNDRIKELEDMPRLAGNDVAGRMLLQFGEQYYDDTNYTDAFFCLCDALMYLREGNDEKNRSLVKETEGEIISIVSTHYNVFQKLPEKKERFRKCVDEILVYFIDKKAAIEIKNKFSNFLNYKENQEQNHK